MSDVMQEASYCFKINTLFILLNNQLEGKIRDLKIMSSIPFEHTTWDEYIPSIRFAVNSTYTAATE